MSNPKVSPPVITRIEFAPRSLPLLLHEMADYIEAEEDYSVVFDVVVDVEPTDEDDIVWVGTLYVQQMG